jgi:hypothetical protein
LVIAGRDGAAAARAALAKLDQAEGNDRKVVEAILASLEAMRLAEAGKLGDARAQLERAQQAHADTPEVHIAAAVVLAASPLTDLSKSEIAELKRTGLVKYPDAAPRRVGEALSELDWSRQQRRGLGTTYAFQGPGVERTMESLEEQLRAFYPYAVEFQPDPVTTFAFKNESPRKIDVEVDAEGFERSIEVKPQQTQTIRLPEAGLVKLRHGKVSGTFVAEPYTKVHVGL